MLKLIPSKQLLILSTYLDPTILAISSIKYRHSRSQPLRSYSLTRIMTLTIHVLTLLSLTWTNSWSVISGMYSISTILLVSYYRGIIVDGGLPSVRAPNCSCSMHLRCTRLSSSVLFLNTKQMQL